ncbi:hypothetical protein LTS07_002806 [Exophiala sideris]|uniref:RNA-binding protein n=1 Tax=Exophiala sideris TaxID=1016849 RepID=A0ABR0JK68_9EURO|nr:hypothetical protein LTS07_002806 [Exophiala sideris]KAK5039280.1 hypothetical protein LTR13_003536 [Exophiala sideris]KAK5066293.1 hypothetical protein LTR69_002812 [Exophiala sideris]KAK5186970.1 hypothetical protein LTR44_000977 [Eurotiomycetes sp. CCFEE 6388]
MSSYRSRGGRDSQQSYRHQPHAHTDDVSRSQSPVRRNTPPHSRRSPPHVLKENFTSVAAVPEVPIEDISATRTGWTTMTERRIGVTTPVHHPHRVVGDNTMTETIHGIVQAEAEAGDEVRQEIDLKVEITSELKQYYHVQHLDDVRVIRDRQTKQSRQFGFLRFATLQEAEDFMDHNYPVLYLYGDSNKSNGDASKVRITFGRERKEPIRAEDADWICPSCNINNFATRNRCFRCQESRPEPGYEVPAKAVNVGDNDSSSDNAPSQFLLLRGLEPSVTEDLLVKGVSKLNKPSASGAQREETSSKKGAKVASTTGDANLGAKEGTLRRVLLVRDRRTNDSWRYGFAEYASIEDAQAALTRFNSFDRFTIASKQVLVSFIHAGVFVPVLNPSPDTERFTFSPIGNPAMKLAYWDEDAYVTELAVSMPTLATQSAKSAPTPADVGGFKVKESDKSKKRKAQTESEAAGVKKPAPSHLQFWSSRHAELHGIKASNSDDSRSTEDNAAPPSQSYADPNRHCCYLCMRQFNSAAEVNKHERLSDLHRQNLQDEAKAKKATAKLEKHGVKHRQAGETQQQYRDRARERRKIYGVVNKKGEQVGAGPKSSRASESDDEAAPPVQSKGASLLSKMGYTAGQGLGASGEGMTVPISQDIYVAGVGLGAQGGKVGDAVAEAERNTKGNYEDFAQRTREGARERYARLG